MTWQLCYRRRGSKKLEKEKRRRNSSRDIHVAALEAQGLVLEEEQEEEPEEVESVTVCYWRIFDESAGRRIGRRSAATLSEHRQQQQHQFEQEQQRCWQLEGLPEEEERK